MAKQKLQFVDALRGAAILLVILVHSSQRLGGVGPWSKGIADLGQFGVQLFFVTSAYTLARFWNNRGDAPRRVSSFYVRRFFRIAPLYYIGIGIYFVVACFLGTEAMYTPGVAANLFFVHGFVPTAANNKIVPGGWSIGTEMAFYGVFPLLVAWAERAAARSRIVSGVAAVSVALVTGDIVLGQYLKSHGIRSGNNTFFYCNFIVQLPVFLIGLLAFFRPIRAGERGRVLSAVGFLLFGSVAALLFWLAGDAGAIASSTVAGVAWLFLLNLVRDVTRVPAWLCSVGRVSFSMYVFHFLFAWYVAEALKPWLQAYLPGFVRVALMFGIASLCTYIVARVTERAIERPGIALGERFLEYRSRRAALLTAG